MYESITSITVRYGETDQMGQVYYGNYSLYYEIGRVEAVRQLGYSYKQMEEEGYIMPVAEMYARYIRPARYDETLTIKTIIKEMPSRKMTFYTEIYNAENQLINSGYTTLLFVDKQHNRVCSPPRKLTEALKPFFDER
jgi:acyl-CoA thioester hydrolase